MKLINILSKITLLLLISFNLQAQPLHQDVSPKGGLNTLAVKYYGIDFTKAQRELLKEKEIEFIFQIDENGNPTLSEINGINDPDIIDSLKNKTNEIGIFNPQITNGVAQPSIYFMQLVFPTYKMTPRKLGVIQGAAYKEAKLEDFEYIKEANRTFEMLIGGMGSQFMGNNLGFGGGMKTEFLFSTKTNYLFGLNTSFYGNKLKTDYSINTTRKQNSSPTTMLVGFIFGKWFNKINIQSEFNLAIQNITPRENINDPDWVQFKGWSPGVIVNYPMRIGKKIPMYYYGSPSILENNINFHLGLRYLFLSIPEANGAMIEVGLSYRMTMKRIKEFKLKDEFLQQY